MLFSIVMPVYNVEPYLEKCLDSLVLQDFSDYEIILVDDGSPDNCPAICDRYAAKYNNIKVVHQENQGLCCARNAGMAKAQGKYLCLIDTDDSVMPEYFAELSKAVEDEPDIVIFGYREECLNGEKDVILKHRSVEETRYNFMTDIWGSYVWNKCLKRELYADLQFIPGKFFEDIHTMPYVFLKARTINCIEKPLYCYNLRNLGGLTRTLHTRNAYDLWEGRYKLETSEYANSSNDKSEWQRRSFFSAKEAFLHNILDPRLNEEQIGKLKAYFQQAFTNNTFAFVHCRLLNKFLAKHFLNEGSYISWLICYIYAYLKVSKDKLKKYF